MVADTFFFREIVIDLEFETDDQLRNIEEFHPFNKPAAQVLRVLLRGGYTALICHLHVRFGFYQELDPDSDDSEIMVNHTDNIWDFWEWALLQSLLNRLGAALLTSQSCLVLSIYVHLNHRQDTRAPGLPKARKWFVHDIREYCKQCPNICLELFVTSCYNSYLESTIDGGTAEREENYIKSNLSDDLLFITDRLELQLYLPISAHLFTSFRSVKTRFLQKTAFSYSNVETIERGLISMPCFSKTSV